MSVTSSILENFPMQKKTAQVFSLAQSFALAGHLPAIGAQHLILALMVLTNTFSQLLQKRLSAYPKTAETVYSDGLLVFKSCPPPREDWVLDDELASILDPTNPASHLFSVL